MYFLCDSGKIMLVNDVKKFLHNSTNLKDVAFKANTYIENDIYALLVQLKGNFTYTSFKSTITGKSSFKI